MSDRTSPTTTGAAALPHGPGLHPALADEVQARVPSAFVRARKPAARACGCADACCA